VREILDEELYRKKYTKVNMRKLIMILDKFKDDKIQSSP
jgi:Fe-S-cluster formation regulator IscX/YfhJ